MNTITADVDGNTMEITLPKFGERISNGVVVEYYHVNDGGNGMLPNGVVLASLPNNTYHPFVVWNAAYNERSGWHCEVGYYSEHIVEAAKEFARRTGR